MARRFARLLLAVLVTVATSVALLSGGIGSAAATTPGSPVGRLDQLRLVGGNLVLTGWALDRDHPSGSQVELYRTVKNTTQLRGHVSTTVVRTDVNRSLHVTGAHGFSLSVPAFAGTQTWCATAVNLGPGVNTALGCRTITVPTGHTPVGSLDSFYDDGVMTQLAGWALDRDDVRDPETVAIYRMTPTRTLLTTIRTTVPRPDVNAALKVTGDHGWTAVLPDPPSQGSQYCAYALNVGVVRPNPQLGCVEVAAGPAAGTIAATSVEAFATTATVTVSVVALPSRPRLRVTRESVSATGDAWSAPAIVDVPLTTTQNFTLQDTGLKANTAYRYTFFLHDAAGRHTTGYQVDVTTAQLAAAHRR